MCISLTTVETHLIIQSNYTMYSEILMILHFFMISFFTRRKKEIIELMWR